MSAAARFSHHSNARGDATYRYQLSRRRDPNLIGDYPPGWHVTFIMLNPSTADASVDDPTIRRCATFAEQCRADLFTVVNLYALRATDPTALIAHPDPIGPANDEHIRGALVADAVICAWGATVEKVPGGPERAAAVLTQVGPRALCLGTTKAGHPRHPLYVKSSTIPRLLQISQPDTAA